MATKTPAPQQRQPPAPPPPPAPKPTVTLAGWLSILLALIALTFSFASFVLPMWTVSQENVGLQLNFGIWGFCLNTAHDKRLMNSCTAFHASTKRTKSFCGRYDAATLRGDIARQALMLPLAAIVEITWEEMDNFARESCSGVGLATLVFGITALVTAFCAFVSLVCVLMWFKSRLWCFTIAKTLLPTAGMSLLLTATLWMVQAKGIDNASHTSLGLAFVFSVFGALIFFVVTGLFSTHEVIRQPKVDPVLTRPRRPSDENKRTQSHRKSKRRSSTAATLEVQIKL
ncbi:hypothetical protein Poli38472_010963 [Pythium oligandrum]|uniref:Uncharacterized protein n=1 Tax=Pythium oligandrum TaxID=41045 RepID=A0A8K1CEU1_PYTOL|nr:hypothetical protein Poli38472_010963 [Pythium oligandrum]|eukprot:TMW61900.1 hypothetical protein Poli38472_010963 [Pythium oligandrum]